MGDRGNIVVQDRDERVFLYTHWSGSTIREVVQKALARRQRWDDPSYLTRIVFDTLTEGDQGGETGFGIWPSLGDNEHKIITIDVGSQQVLIGSRDEADDSDGRVSFEDWAAGNYPGNPGEEEEED